MCLLGGLVGCTADDPETPQLVVSAASSLADVVTRLGEEYERRGAGVRIATNFASSGTLLQQIRQGAEVDVFISASDREIALLRREGLLVEGSVAVVASNELVLVVPVGIGGREDVEMRDLAGPGVELVALGAPASVPAGAYAREMLQSLGLWDAVEQKAVFATNVRQALRYVESGSVDAAFVYRTDALQSRRARVAAVAPPASHSPIRYTAAVVTTSDSPLAARRFLEFASGPAGEAVFRAHGFTMPAADEAN